MSKTKCVCLVICIVMLLTSVTMLMTGARGNVDVSSSASLTLTYRHSDKFFSDVNVKVYRVADMVGNTTFVLGGDFYDVPVELNKIKSQGEWNQVASTLSAYVISEALLPTRWGVTDEDGKIAFQELPVGLYLVDGVRVEVDDGYYVFDSFMITVPGVDLNEEWNYHVEALPKSHFEEHEDREVEYKINKLWRDDGKSEKRPQSVEIELYKDGEYVESVALSSYNDWSYSWKSTESAVWTAVEKNVAEGYKVTVEQSGYSFIVTNTYDDPTPPPQTGDSSSVYLTVAILSAAGICFILFGLKKGRGKLNEKY